jgi:RND superfamily putative drug exporter
VVLGGNRLLQDEVNEQTEKDTQFAEFVALPATLVVMVFVFGGWAAGIPLIAALVTIGGSLLALLGFSYVIDEMDPSVVSVCTVLGLGLSIDYALLMVNRFREERGLGFDSVEAVARTAATSGRTILFSGLTVATSLAGLFVFDLSIFKAIGAAGLSVVVVAMLAALTLTPALIALFGRGIRVPTEPVSDEGGFRRLAAVVQRRAAVVTIVVSALLASAAIPFLGVSFRNGSADLLPAEFESRQFAELQRDRFPSAGVEPVVVVAETSPERLQAYGERFTRDPGVAAVADAEEVAPGLSRLEITPRGGDSQGDQALALVRTLRADRPEGSSWVTGDAAILADFKHAVAVRVPWALAIVVTATFVLLFLMTGSLLVPLKALVMNVLSLGASYGALVWIFQEGNLSGLLGFTSNGGLETWVPVITFAFAFGLSMDYEVFLLSRVKELYDSGRSNDEAVAIGLQRSGRIITLAALLVVIVFLGFAAGKMLAIKQLGVALAIAAFVDATLVRCLLVPATMTLLGDANWWAPRPLRRLHARIGFSEHTELPAQANERLGVSANAPR